MVQSPNKCAVGMVLALAALVAPGTPRVHAGYQSVTVDFNQSNVFGFGNYGTVQIEADTGAGTVKFTVTALTSVYSSIDSKAFGIDKFAFNFDSNLTLTTGQVTVNKGGWTPTIDPANSVSQFGKFDLEDAGSGASHRVDPLIVTITGLGADALVSNFEFLSDNGHPPAYFAAHVAGFSQDGQSSHYIAVTDVSTAPEPASAIIFGLGTIGVAGYGWRKRKPRA
jgi:PEP-CTERM motif-containing protein